MDDKTGGHGIIVQKSVHFVVGLEPNSMINERDCVAPVLYLGNWYTLLDQTSWCAARQQLGLLMSHESEMSLELE